MFHFLECLLKLDPRVLTPLEEAVKGNGFVYVPEWKILSMDKNTVQKYHTLLIDSVHPYISPIHSVHPHTYVFYW